MEDQARKTLEITIQKAQSLGADQAEAVFINDESNSVAYRMGEKEINSSRTSGIGIRIIKEGKQACISTSDLNQVEAMAEKAMNLIKYLPSNKYNSLPPEDSYHRDEINLDLLDTKSVDLDTLLDKAKTCEEIALSQEHIFNSEGAECSKSIRTRAMLNSQGFFSEYSTSFASLSCCVVGKSDGKMERDYHYSQARHFADLETEEQVGLKAAENTAMRLNPRKISSRKCPVVFDRRVAKSLLQDVVDAINGASLVRTKTFLSGKLGEQVFSKETQIINDPHIKRGLGSLPFDHEGVANSKNTIVQNGVLKSYILDWITSQEMKMENTANAKRSLSSPPYPGPDNLFLSKGKMSLLQLFKEMKNGVWVREIIGNGVNLTTGDYSVGASGMWIEDGEIAYPVSEITLSGNLINMLKTAVPGDDLVLDSSICSPSLLLDNVTLGGK